MEARINGEQALRRKLRTAGYSNLAIDAVWPQWWSSEADSSTSAQAELRFTVARKLGIRPSSLLYDGEPSFAWSDTTRFKNLGATSIREQQILGGFATSLARVMIAACEQPPPPLSRRVTAMELRNLVTPHDLHDVLTVTWLLGIPVLQTRVFPLRHKRMHAASTSIGGRHAIIVGLATPFPSKASFAIAHELGHLFLGHTREARSFLDIGDPAEGQIDDEEGAANQFALEYLTGSPDPQIDASTADYNSTSLATAARDSGRKLGIDPGVLVQSFAYRHNDWARGTAALQLLGEVDVAAYVNGLARAMFEWTRLSDDDASFLQAALG